MRHRQKLLILFILILLFSTSVLFYITFLTSFKESKIGIMPMSQADAQVQEVLRRNAPKQVFKIAFVACGERLQEALTMIKSALLFNPPRGLLHFIIFADDNMKSQLEEKLRDWDAILPNVFTFKFHPIEFPKLQEEEWQSLYKPCASQRLFLPSLLRSIDSLLYVDTDVLFLSPVSDIWQYFGKFNATQMYALVPEQEGIRGFNSGVMLMNLTRMRNFKWETHVHDVYEQYKSILIWGDQDIINIIIRDNSEKVYGLNCLCNYRPEHCIFAYLPECRVTDGIKILHGVSGYFHSDEQSLFRIIYDIFDRYEYNSEPRN